MKSKLSDEKRKQKQTRKLMSKNKIANKQANYWGKIKLSNKSKVKESSEEKQTNKLGRESKLAVVARF